MEFAWPYFLIFVLGVLPTEIWRLLGVFGGRALDEKSDLFVWLKSTGVGILAALVAQLVLVPPGQLAQISMGIRITAIAIGLGVYFLVGRSIILGVIVGSAALFCGAFFL